MRNTFSMALYEHAVRDPSIFVVVADISPAGSMNKFREEYPERFINVGVAEQAMIGMCAGLALRGCRPFAYTIATFSLYRPFEMVRDDLCYQNLPVTVVGMGAGLIYSSLGGTHHTQEDIAIAGALPNMQIIAPCDPLEAIEATGYCATQKKGPVYLRLGKAGEPNITEQAEPFKMGKLRHLWKGEDVAVLSYGVNVHMGLEVATGLRERGDSVTLISCHTMKPLDRDGIADVLRRHKKVIVMEEHAPQGGLASSTKQIAWDIGAICDLQTFTLKDEFIHFYGTHEELLAKHGLSSERILEEVR